MKNMNAKVTIIIPVYNVENYIDRCMESVLGQSYDNLEIILIDDGSKDASGKKIDEYALKDNRIVALHKENGGQASARNLGLSKATGEYVCFVDSDDCIHERYVELLLDICENRDCDLAICAYENFSGNDINWKKDISDSNITFEKSTDTLNAIFSPRNVETIVVWNKMYKMDNIRDIHFTEGRIFEDEAISARLIYSADRVGRIDAPLYYYYQNDSGTMGGEFTLKKLDILWALEDRMDFFKEKELTALYQKDSYKYMCKLLTHYYRVMHMKPNHPEIATDIMEKYRKKRKESLGFGWSKKRNMAMRLFGIFPGLYPVITKKY